MNKTSNRFLWVIVLCMLAAFILPAAVSANSAEPPSLVILVLNPPDDLSITLISNESHSEAIVRRTAWEGYYLFYSRDMKAGDQYTFQVTSNGESYECSLGESVQHYNNVYTLDLSTRELTPGGYPFRSVLLVSIRVFLTLLLEGIIFWLFGFRQKWSWLIFLVINLVTQGALNIWLTGDGSPTTGYWIIGLIFGEIFVFAAEMIAFPILINEQKKSRILIYALIANLVSLFAGGYLMSILPI